ncbi:MAG: hypothetical protein ACRDHY_17855, partial [Anaerolineales bacterium]
PEDHEHNEMCKNRGARDPLPPAAKQAEGIWSWELADVRQGIIDIVWDVAKVGAPAGASPPLAQGQPARG